MHFYLEINNLISYRRNESESTETSRGKLAERDKNSNILHTNNCVVLIVFFFFLSFSPLIFPLNATCWGGGGVFRIFHLVAARQFRIYWRPIKPCVRCVYRISMIIIFAFFIYIIFTSKFSLRASAKHTHIDHFVVDVCEADALHLTCGRRCECARQIQNANWYLIFVFLINI